jgi:substrate import-associated zinc metallohydrolase lipoprotein
VAGDWSTSSYNTYYRQRGFLSTYAQDSDREDFAEVLSLYVTNTEEQMQEWLEDAGRQVTEDDFDEADKNKDHFAEFHSSFPDVKVGQTFPGRELILAKIDLVRKYFMDNFDIDIDELRDAVLRRQKDVIEGKVDLTSLEIN